jgi:two-component sensor histidine kinase
MGATIFFSGEFAIAFLGVKKRLLYGIRIVSISGVVTFVLSLTCSYTIAIKCATFITVFGSFGLFLAGVIAWQKKNRLAPYYTIAWSIYLFFLIIGALRAFGLIPSNYWTYKSSHFGSATEVLFLAFALAYKYKLIINDRLNAQKELYQAQQEINLKLDKKVSERTVHLEKTINEKEVLIKEVHHRVKNNLQLVTSLLNLHIRKLTDKNAIVALEDSKRRVDVMADIHEQLYSDKSDLIDQNVDTYLERFIALIKESYVDRNVSIILLRKSKLSMSFDKTILLALIINEITNNSVKHGGDASNKIDISIDFKVTDSFAVLEIRNVGKLLPTDFSLEENGQLGTRIILALSKQLNAEYNLTNNENLTGVVNHLKIDLA